MQHSNELIQAAATEATPLDGAQNLTDAIVMSDRSTPRWALGIAILYAAVTAAVYLATAVATIFLFDLVAVEGQLRFAVLITAVIAIPLIGTSLIDYAYRWSMSGMKNQRNAVMDKASGIVGLVALLMLTMVQPLFALPIAGSVAIAGFGIELLRRFDRREDAWEFRSEEAASFLSGRDDFGFRLALQRGQTHTVAASMHRIGVALAGLSGFALGAWLAAESVLTLEAVAALSFVAMVTTDLIVRALKSLAFADVLQQARDAVVLPPRQSEEAEVDDAIDALSVKELTVVDADGRCLLEKVSFDVAPGAIVQITGSSGDGKSLLMRAMSDPFALASCQVQGAVHFAGVDLWDRRPNRRTVPAVRVDPDPMILPASTRDNITCFQPDLSLDRVRVLLRKLVHSEDIVHRLTSPNVHAPALPQMQRKVLGLVRAFLISPHVLLLDRPEAFLPERQIGQLVNLIEAQARMGRITLLVTDNRALLDACDTVLVLQGGRVIDYGDGAEIRARHGSGWRRFTGKRALETEEALHSWLKSQFIRDGDEGNQRRVCKIASNALAYFCMTTDAKRDAEIIFECKQRAGAMELRIIDNLEPISIVQFEKARQELEQTDLSARLSPLAQVIRDTLSAVPSTDFGRRELSLEIETYDPRSRAQKDSK